MSVWNCGGVTWWRRRRRCDKRIIARQWCGVSMWCDNLHAGDSLDSLSSRLAAWQTYGRMTHGGVLGTDPPSEFALTFPIAQHDFGFRSNRLSSETQIFVAACWGRAARRGRLVEEIVERCRLWPWPGMATDPISVPLWKRTRHTAVPHTNIFVVGDTPCRVN